MTTVTEGLADVKDQARQAESRTDLAPAMLSLEQRIDQVGFASSRLAFWKSEESDGWSGTNANST